MQFDEGNLKRIIGERIESAIKDVVRTMKMRGHDITYKKKPGATGDTLSSYDFTFPSDEVKRNFVRAVEDKFR